MTEGHGSLAGKIGCWREACSRRHSMPGRPPKPFFWWLYQTVLTGRTTVLEHGGPQTRGCRWTQRRRDDAMPLSPCIWLLTRHTGRGARAVASRDRPACMHNCIGITRPAACMHKLSVSCCIVVGVLGGCGSVWGMGVMALLVV